MIHYHGTPCGGEREQASLFIRKRHVLIPFPRPEDLPAAMEYSTGFCVDNGAFTAWKSGEAVVEWGPYYEWVHQICRNPRFTFAIIPDVIDGTEDDNDSLLAQWRTNFRRREYGAPVWHMHESLARLDRLVAEWPRVCLGSSGAWPTPGTDGWWNRMDEAMSVACDRQGRPRARLHGLRMLDRAIFTGLPLESADSTNVVRNAASVSRFGMYRPPTLSQRMANIAEQIESENSPSVYVKRERTAELFALK